MATLCRPRLSLGLRGSGTRPAPAAHARRLALTVRANGDKASSPGGGDGPLTRLAIKESELGFSPGQSYTQTMDQDEIEGTDLMAFIDGVETVVEGAVETILPDLDVADEVLALRFPPHSSPPDPALPWLQTSALTRTLETPTFVSQLDSLLQGPGKAAEPASTAAEVAAAEHLARQLSPGRFVGGTLLVTGGTVGAGILALPAATAAAGFVPSSVALCGAWAYMCTTALMLVEMGGWYGSGSNLMTMARRTLGRRGVVVGATLYVFVYLSTLVAYVSEGSKALVTTLGMSGAGIPAWCACAAFTAALGGVVGMGTEPVDRANRALSAFALVAFVALLSVAFQGASVAVLFDHSSWPAAARTLPITIVAFNYHNLVPSLAAYVGTRRRAAAAVACGSGIPLVIYIVWQAAVLGMGASATVGGGALLAASGAAASIIPAFSFAAIATSYLGVSLGFVDFVQDLLGSETARAAPAEAAMSAARSSARVRRGAALALTFAPPLLIAVVWGSSPGIFHAALQFGGTLDLVLFGAMPAAMLWVGRYRQGRGDWLPGGRALLVAIVAVAAVVGGLEVGPFLSRLLLLG